MSAGQVKPSPGGPIFRSGWNPRGVRRIWRRVPIANDVALKALADLKWDRFTGADIAEAIGWFDARRQVKLFFVRLASGDDVLLRTNARGNSLEFSARRQIRIAPKAGVR